MQWHPTPVLLPAKSHGRSSLVGCSPWGREESDTTERLHFHFYALEKEMATHSRVLAWRNPGTEEPSGLPSMGSHRVRHDRSDLAVSRLKTSKAKLTPSYFSSHNTSANLQTASPTSLELQHENYSLVFHFLYFLL